MVRRHFFWQLYALFLGLSLVVFVAASEYAARGFREFYYEQAAHDLISRAKLASELFAGRETPSEADAFCKEIAQRADIRLTIVLPDGSVLADSAADPKSMDNHGQRPEIQAAFNGGTGRMVRFSDTTREERMYVAVPIFHQGRIDAVIRTSIPTEPLAQTLRAFQNKLALTVFVLGLVVFAAVFVFLQRISRPLQEMRLGAQRFAEGDLSFRLRPPGYEELASLADALNSMAGQLKTRIEVTSHQRDQMHAVLGSMREAVIAVDAGEHILQINRAAAELLGISVEAATGQMLAGVIRNSELLRLLRSALGNHEAAEGEVTMVRENAERILQIHATPLRDDAGVALGAMIVANDITQLRRLERVRRDFVANVSHELKTPLTSIKGFVETLQDGALEQPDEARRFLDIIARQVGRLQAVLNDLLILSRIEQQAERDELSFQDDLIKPALDAAVELCLLQANKKQIAIKLECPPDARGRINTALLEQAAANLIENAVKYSEPGKTIRIHAHGDQGGWRIDFTDQGCGIERQHLDRVFERFYRVDKARTRSEGGTGLGLSIVKHIMTAHGGNVSVQSTPGVGSVFTLHLPPAQAAS